MSLYDQKQKGKSKLVVYLWISYIPLTEFEGRAVSYGPRFVTSIHDLSAQHKGHEMKWKKQSAVTYSTDRENQVL